MNVVRYQPWPPLRQFHHEVNRLFNDLGANGVGEDRSRVVTGHWVPAVDIREEDDRFVLTADLPGVEPKDIAITMDDGVLTLRGERKHAAEQDGNGLRRSERAGGAFYRRFSLPDSADAERITARSENGVLEVSIPKQEKVQPKRIAVQ
jgi:HSP20 family protein